MDRHFYERGLVHPLVIATIVLSVLVAGLSAFGIWAYINYQDYRNNAEEKITAATADARRVQKEEDEKEFLEREKEPTRQLVGPEDLGRVSLSYPKTWSVYIERSGGTYEAYLHPGAVPPLSGSAPYALRISIVDRQYEREVAGYERAIAAGDLKASPVSVQGETGTRLDGAIARDVQGSMAIFKVRDKTLRVYTESRTFEPDFNEIILKTLNFNR